MAHHVNTRLRLRYSDPFRARITAAMHGERCAIGHCESIGNREGAERHRREYYRLKLLRDAKGPMLPIVPEP